MTFPVWIEIGGLRVHPHLVFEALAYVGAFWIYLRRRRTQGDHLPDEARWSVVTAAVVGSLAGSHLLNWLAADAGGVAGKTLVGGVLGGWLAVELEKKRIGIRERTGDLFAMPIAVGMAIGRIGCFLSGLPDGTYGVATALPWGVDLGDGVLRHPTALYESLFMAIIAVVLWRLDGRLPRGGLFRALAASYLAFRLVVDFIKPGVSLLWGLTGIQIACIVGLAVLVRRAIADGSKAAVHPTSVHHHH
jgi:phosphatidylglycerol---prolipoprotein diacylglyceryl transferase